MQYSSHVLLCALLAAFVAIVPASPASGGPAVVRDDINGDGKGDLLVGVPLESVRGADRAGGVNVVLSNGRRLATAGNQFLTQAAESLTEVEVDDLFGSSVELIDTNGDGYAEAIIGSSGETVESEVNAGAVMVVPGSPQGLRVGELRRFVQGQGLPDNAEAGDFFGFNIATGDFDGDGYGDVVASAPFDDVNGRVDAGAVTVIPGSPSGLDPSSARSLTQGPETAGVPNPGDFFGWSLASGDFNGDGFDDLVVGAPGQDSRPGDDSGAATVFYGSPTGLVGQGSRVFSQAGRVKNVREADDLFSFSVAASDLNCDGFDDLAVGVPNETLGPDGVVAGLVNVLFGSEDGVRIRGNRVLAQGLGAIAGKRDFNQFGAALAAGDFDGDGCGDLAVSAHTTDIGSIQGQPCLPRRGCVKEAGAVVVVSGARSWTRISSRQFSQKGPIVGIPQARDFFGRTLGVVDVNGDGRDELVVGVPREDRSGRVDAGQVTVLRGTARGLSEENSYLLAQGRVLAGRLEAGEQFGSSLEDATS